MIVSKKQGFGDIFFCCIPLVQADSSPTARNDNDILKKREKGNGEAVSFFPFLTQPAVILSEAKDLFAIVLSDCHPRATLPSPLFRPEWAKICDEVHRRMFCIGVGVQQTVVSLANNAPHSHKIMCPFITSGVARRWNKQGFQP
jgi:hypothetical protein